MSPNDLYVVTFRIQRLDVVSAIPFDFVEVVHLTFLVKNAGTVF
jgi:hypothetical protein